MAYVWLTNLNDSVSWTNPVAGANTMVIRNCIPDAPNGGGITATINLYVDGVFRQAITLTSTQSWNYRNSTTTPDDPNGGGTPWHFYNATRYGVARWFEAFETLDLHVSDNFTPAHALTWMASEAEALLRRELSPAEAERFASASTRDLIALWRDHDLH